jgi:hypothetical protein
VTKRLFCPLVSGFGNWVLHRPEGRRRREVGSGGCRPRSVPGAQPGTRTSSPSRTTSSVRSSTGSFTSRPVPRAPKPSRRRSSRADPRGLPPPPRRRKLDPGFCALGRGGRSGRALRRDRATPRRSLDRASGRRAPSSDGRLGLCLGTSAETLPIVSGKSSSTAPVDVVIDVNGCFR